MAYQLAENNTITHQTNVDGGRHDGENLSEVGAGKFGHTERLIKKHASAGVDGVHKNLNLADGPSVNHMSMYGKGSVQAGDYSIGDNNPS